MGRVWTLEEEEIVCGGFLRNPDDCRKHAEEILAILKSKGYQDRTIETILAKLKDYKRIAEYKLDSHIAPKSIEVYKRKTAERNKRLNEIDQLLQSLGNLKESDDLDAEVNVASEKPQMKMMTKESFSPSTTSFIVTNMNSRMTPSFTDLLNRLLFEDGRDNSEIYGSVWMSRQDFSKILQGKSLTKRNLLKLAIALKLEAQVAKDFLGSAGLSLTRSSKLDIVVLYALDNKIYDPFEIDEALEHEDLPTLFAEA